MPRPAASLRPALEHLVSDVRPNRRLICESCAGELFSLPGAGLFVLEGRHPVMRPPVDVLKPQLLVLTLAAVLVLVRLQRLTPKELRVAL